jgi:hypothetical protein
MDGGLIFASSLVMAAFMEVKGPIIPAFITTVSDSFVVTLPGVGLQESIKWPPGWKTRSRLDGMNCAVYTYVWCGKEQAVTERKNRMARLQRTTGRKRRCSFSCPVSCFSGIVNLFVEMKFIAELEKGKGYRTVRGLECSAIRHPFLLRLAHSKSGIGSVK